MSSSLSRNIERTIGAVNPTPVQAAQSPLRRRQGVVSDTATDGTVMVSVGGGSPAGPFPTLQPYRPQIGDTVWMLKEGPDWLVLGATGADQPYAATVQDTGLVSMSSGTTVWTYPSYDLVLDDPHGMFDPNFPLRVYARRTGWYTATADSSISTNGTGDRRVNFRVDGDDGQLVGDDTRRACTGIPTRISSTTTDFFLTDGQFVQARYQQTSGSTLNLEPTTYSTKMTLRLVRPA
jgi:hypothetical protein